MIQKSMVGPVMIVSARFRVIEQDTADGNCERGA